MNKNIRSLTEAYDQVIINELNWKGPLAAAAMAVGSAHGGDLEGDLINKDYKLDKPTTVEQPAVSKATEAYNKFRNGNKLNDEEVKALATDKEYAKDYIIYLRQRSLPIPAFLKAASPDTVKSTAHYVGG